MTERLWTFLDEGIVGFAGLAICLVIILPMLPLIALGYAFSRLAARIEARRAKTACGLGSREPDTAAHTSPPTPSPKGEQS